MKGLLNGVTPAQKAELAGGTVEDWSRKAWENARTYAYTTALGDPCRERAKDERGVVTEAEVQALIPAVRQQVLAGGLRLARMLDDAILRGQAPGLQRVKLGTPGVLKLNLGAGSYDWKFVPIVGKTFTDTGTDECH